MVIAITAETQDKKNWKVNEKMESNKEQDGRGQIVIVIDIDRVNSRERKRRETTLAKMEFALQGRRLRGEWGCHTTRPGKGLNTYKPCASTLYPVHLNYAMFIYI